MEFSANLNKYIKELNCSLNELALSSNLSITVISRYRSGKRTPKATSKQAKQLVDGIYILFQNKGNKIITKKQILETLFMKNKNSINIEIFVKNFSHLISTLNINMSEMAKSLNYDASYLSRIKTGRRIPNNIDTFIKDICNYCYNKYYTKKELLTHLLSCKENDISNKEEFINKLYIYLSSTNTITDNYIDRFLKKLDEFNLNEYIRLIHFNELKVYTIPFKLPTSKRYYGLIQMRNAELDFLKSTIFSKAKEDVFMCSDMPMEDMAKDVEFGKKWMFGIAMMLKKGLHLNIIHNLNRPFKEMMLGLESWIPIYMTGQVSPYYFKSTQNSLYNNLNYVSGDFALQGECIKNHHNKGKYYLTNDKKEIIYYKEKAKLLINNSSPLIDIYRRESKKLYNSFIKNDIKEQGNRHNIFSTIPIYTIENDLLIKILKRNNISDKDINKILEFVELKQKQMIAILKNNTILDEISKISKEEFNNYPIYLCLSEIFYEKRILYTYEEYVMHLDMCKKFEKQNKNYKVNYNKNYTFRNIQVLIHKNKNIVITKENDPTIHFIIKHPKLMNAIENFTAPIVD